MPSKKKEDTLFDLSEIVRPILLYPDDSSGDWPKRTPDTFADHGIDVESIAGSNPESANDSGREGQG